MSHEEALADAGGTAARTSRVVNDFSITVATVNGSGSQTANNTILRTIFQMGIPCSGKNLFPSNIAGLPTWFTIRASGDGWIARRREVDVLIAMNLATAEADLASVRPGGAVIFDEPLKLGNKRSDVTFYPVPFAKLVAQVCPEARLRKLVTNMLYVGVAAELFGLELGEIRKALGRAFAKKPKALELNVTAVDAGVAYAREHLPKRDPFEVERMDANAGQILIDGNAAAALGCMMAGVSVVAWYPITPSSSLAESLIDYLEDHRIDPETNKATFAVVQAEDEIAALGMVVGAGWAGARAMTTTSGPGISLMSEFTGLAYYAEVPAVIFDVQRTGPSTGLPTRTMQGDLLSTALLSHGDTKHLLLIPASVEEAYELAQAAFDLAERFQTIVFVMSDLDLGMNIWMSKTFEYPQKPLDRGKVLDQAALAALGAGKFLRYGDVEGDGIPYRTLPGTPGGLGAYFTRGSGHDEKAGYTESGAVYVRNMDRLSRKLETARRELPKPIVERAKDGEASVGILAFGTSHYGVQESRAQLARDHGFATDYCRVRAFPFADEVREFLQRHEVTYVVEQNRDAQMRSLLSMEFPDLAPRLRSVLHYDGLPLDARTVTEGIVAAEGLGAGRLEEKTA
jgi:2-oxoglutarate ferredoxin oxidoreductase subunit alpha